jgi:NADH dehydrogenase
LQLLGKESLGMVIFLTGSSGFVGNEICRALIKQGHRVRCLVRGESDARLPASPLIEAVSADLFNTSQLTAHMHGCDAVIHLVGIIREFPAKGITFERLHHQATTAVVSACLAAGIKRYLHMSANGTRPQAVTRYHQTKWLAEEEVRGSELDWTIFRPSLIYGINDQFINMISGLIRRLPIIPVMGDGTYCLQPVPVEIVAAGFAQALLQPKAIGKTYHCGGADCLSYNRLLDEVGLAIGKNKVAKIHQPLVLIRPIVNLLQHVALFPLTSDQLRMLLEGNCCDTSDWLDDLALVAPSFRTGLEYLKG